MSTREEDAALAEKLKSHHAVMIKDLDRLSRDLAATAASGADAAPAKRGLEAWIRDVLVPHAEQEEATTYRAAGKLPEGRLLIQAMLEEHVLIRRIAAHVSAAANPITAGTYARALLDVFESHQRKENDIILPLLVESDAVSLTAVMGAAHHAHGDEHGHVHGHKHSH
jgi:hypothetical protein